MELTAEEAVVEWPDAVVRHGWRSALPVAAANGFLHITRLLFWGFAAQTKEFGASSAKYNGKIAPLLLRCALAFSKPIFKFGKVKISPNSHTFKNYLLG